LRRQPPGLAHAGGTDHIAKAQRRRDGLRQAAHHPDPFRRQRPQRGDIAFRHRIAVVLEDLQVEGARDLGDAPSPAAPPASGRWWGSAPRSSGTEPAPRGGGRRPPALGNDAVRRSRPHHLGPGGAGGIAEAGIGQFLDQHRPAGRRAGSNRGSGRSHSARHGSAHMSSGADRPQDAVAHPAHDLGAQRRLGALAGVVEPALPGPSAMSSSAGPEGLGLAHLGHLRRAQVDKPGRAACTRSRYRGCVGPSAGLCGYKGAAADGRRHQPLLRRQLIGPRHRARGQLQPPGQIAHRRQLRTRRQRPPDRLAQCPAERQIFRPGKGRQVRLSILYQSQCISGDSIQVFDTDMLRDILPRLYQHKGDGDVSRPCRTDAAGPSPACPRSRACWSRQAFFWPAGMTAAAPATR
jgi:hypothetical protein